MGADDLLLVNNTAPKHRWRGNPRLFNTGVHWTYQELRTARPPADTAGLQWATSATLFPDNGRVKRQYLLELLHARIGDRCFREIQLGHPAHAAKVLEAGVCHLGRIEEEAHQ